MLALFWSGSSSQWWKKLIFLPPCCPEAESSKQFPITLLPWCCAGLLTWEIATSALSAVSVIRASFLSLLFPAGLNLNRFLLAMFLYYQVTLLILTWVRVTINRLYIQYTGPTICAQYKHTYMHPLYACMVCVDTHWTNLCKVHRVTFDVVQRCSNLLCVVMIL